MGFVFEKDVKTPPFPWLIKKRKDVYSLKARQKKSRKRLQLIVVGGLIVFIKATGSASAIKLAGDRVSYA